jgi:hypothetical protein
MFIFLATQQIGNDLDHLKRWFESQNTTEDQLREKFRQWLSPPDPSINYNTARDAYHNGTAAWFTQDQTFQDWKVSGSESLLWIHGKRMFLLRSASSLLPMSPTLAGSGKSILRYATIQMVIFHATHIVDKLRDHP